MERELACRRKDGSLFSANVSLSAIDSESGPLLAAPVRIADALGCVVTTRDLPAERDRLLRIARSGSHEEYLALLTAVAQSLAV